MRRKMFYTIAVAIFFLSLNPQPAAAQTDEARKVEVGGHFSVLNGLERARERDDGVAMHYPTMSDSDFRLRGTRNRAGLRRAHRL